MLANYQGLKVCPWSRFVQPCHEPRMYPHFPMHAIGQGYTVRRHEVPKSVPTPTLPTTHDATTDKPVLLYSDTNAWWVPAFPC